MVWDALINPELVKKYFFGTQLECTWEIGSRITFTGEWEGKPYQDKGMVLAFEPLKMLKYNYWSSFSGTEDVPANYANVVYEIMAVGEGTQLTIKQDGFKDQTAKEHSAQNWQMLLESIKKMLEQA